MTEPQDNRGEQRSASARDLTLKLVVDATGAVFRATATPNFEPDNLPPTPACLENAVSGLRFAPLPGAVTTIWQRVRFQP